MASSNYRLFEQAKRKPVFCVYEGYPRELCPIILGHSQQQEKVLAYQFGGQSKSGLPREGQWRCLWLAKVSAAQLHDGPGEPVPAIPSHKAASRLSISM